MNPNTEFHKNPSVASRAVPCGQTGGRKDEHDKASMLKISGAA